MSKQFIRVFLKRSFIQDHITNWYKYDNVDVYNNDLKLHDLEHETNRPYLYNEKDGIAIGLHLIKDNDDIRKCIKKGFPRLTNKEFIRPDRFVLCDKKDIEKLGKQEINVDIVLSSLNNINAYQNILSSRKRQELEDGWLNKSKKCENILELANKLKSKYRNLKIIEQINQLWCFNENLSKKEISNYLNDFKDILGQIESLSIIPDDWTKETKQLGISQDIYWTFKKVDDLYKDIKYLLQNINTFKENAKIISLNKKKEIDNKNLLKEKNKFKQTVDFCYLVGNCKIDIKFNFINKSKHAKITLCCNNHVYKTLDIKKDEHKNWTEFNNIPYGQYKVKLELLVNNKILYEEELSNIKIDKPSYSSKPVITN